MKIIFDILILTGIIMTALPAVILLYHRKNRQGSWEGRHARLSLYLAILLLLGTAILLYGSFVEPRILTVNKQTIDLPNIEGPIRIVFFADTQVGPYHRSDYIEKIVDKIIALEPDLALIGGDLVDNGIPRQEETIYLEPLKKLAQLIPTYAVHGNHEYGVSYAGDANIIAKYLPDVSNEVKLAVEKLEVHYLINNLELVSVRNENFYLFGGDCWWAKKLDFSVLKNRTKTNVPTVALIHNPAAAWEASKHNINLMVSGHTHGGQIRLPLIGPLALVDNVVPRKWHQGLHETNGMKLFVTSGAGETGARARLFNPPEIVLLTIK
jgi:hypothetical protein